MALGGGAPPVFAVSGETAATINLSSADCGLEDVDIVAACVAGTSDCGLFSVATAEDTLPTSFCSNRTVLQDFDLLPGGGVGDPIEEDISILGTSFGWIRTLQLDGDVVHALTQTIGDNPTPGIGDSVQSVKVTPADDSGTISQCQFTTPRIRLVEDGLAREEFCARIADALPTLGLSGGDLALVAGYNYKQEDDGTSAFGTSQFLKVWACPGFDAQCVSGSPAQFDDAPPPNSAKVLDELDIDLGLTGPDNTWWRCCG